jgi:hypothetical protein
MKSILNSQIVRLIVNSFSQKYILSHPFLVHSIKFVKGLFHKIDQDLRKTQCLNFSLFKHREYKKIAEIFCSETTF